MIDNAPKTEGTRRREWPVYALMLACISIEALLSLADAGVLGVSGLRAWSYEYFGFWPNLLGAQTGHYALQPALMFFTYSLLHSGPMHLGVNMLTLWSLGHVVAKRVGPGRFLILYLVSAFGGGLGFALLGDPLRLMVGASGALFGLAGALLAWASLDCVVFRERFRPVLWTALVLLVLNVVIWAATQGQLAWEAHLGGFVFGALAALPLYRQNL